MREIFRTIRDFCKKADMILLALCVAASVFGIVAISSATNFLGGGRYVRTQIIALVLGVICYILLTLIDVDIIAERRELLLLFCTVFIALHTAGQPQLAEFQLSPLQHPARRAL